MCLQCACVEIFFCIMVALRKLTWCVFSAGTNDSYTLVSAIDALNDPEAPHDEYVNECQDFSSLNQTIVQGNLLMCSYSIKFVLGQSTINNAIETARNLSAAGIVFTMDPFIIGFQLNPVPMSLPGIIIPSANDSKVSNII